MNGREYLEKKGPKGVRKVYGIPKYASGYRDLDLATKLENEMKYYYERYAVFCHRKPKLGPEWSQYWQFSSKSEAIKEAKGVVKDSASVNGAVVLDRKKGKIIQRISESATPTERQIVAEGKIYRGSLAQEHRYIGLGSELKTKWYYLDSDQRVEFDTLREAKQWVRRFLPEIEFKRVMPGYYVPKIELFKI